jgi:hypothetical protein
MAFLMFIIRSSTFEYRWFFPLLIAMLPMTAKGVTSFSDYTASYLGSKKFKYVFIILIVLLGVYTQIHHADAIIKLKLSSYSPVRESGLWLKENSNPNDIIVSASVTQHTYYSERKIEDYYIDETHNETLFDEEIKKIKPRYIIVSVFEPVFTPQWAYEWPQKHNDTIVPVQAYFENNNQNQPLLIIYEFKNEKQNQTPSSLFS